MPFVSWLPSSEINGLQKKKKGQFFLFFLSEATKIPLLSALFPLRGERGSEPRLFSTQARPSEKRKLPNKRRTGGTERENGSSREMKKEVG